MSSLLILGFIIGMRHALEADHVAAVASLATNTTSMKQAVKQGTAWGIGHTLTLFIFGTIVLWMDTVMSEALADMLEFFVGCMLVILGVDVISRIIQSKIHYHAHSHGKHQHFHAHSHAQQLEHNVSSHQHEHTEAFPFKSLFVGLMHGMAGSAALILLTIETVKSPLEGMAYMLIFGVGSIIGMAALSIIIAIPLRSSAKGLTWLHNSFQMLIGIFTFGLGSTIVYNLA